MMSVHNRGGTGIGRSRIARGVGVLALGMAAGAADAGVERFVQRIVVQGTINEVVPGRGVDDYVGRSVTLVQQFPFLGSRPGGVTTIGRDIAGSSLFVGDAGRFSTATGIVYDDTLVPVIPFPGLQGPLTFMGDAFHLGGPGSLGGRISGDLPFDAFLLALGDSSGSMFDERGLFRTDLSVEMLDARFFSLGVPTLNGSSAAGAFVEISSVTFLTVPAPGAAWLGLVAGGWAMRRRRCGARSSSRQAAVRVRHAGVGC